MPRQIAKYKIELNSSENLRDLLQNIIDLTGEQIKQAQDEINKLKNSTDLTEEAMDSKSKYAKAVNDFMAIKDKALGKRIDVAKILDEVIKHNGDVQDSLEGASKGGIDFNALRNMVDETIQSKSGAGETKMITLKK